MNSAPYYTRKEIDTVFGMLVSPSYRLKNEWHAYLQKRDPEVLNLLSAGLIEGIQQICAYDERIDMRYDFDLWLLPQTKPIWDELAYGFYSTLFADRDRTRSRSRENKRS